MAKCVFVSVLLIIASLVVSGQDHDISEELAIFNPKIKFGDFSVPVYTGEKAEVNINSSKTAHQYRTVIQHAYKTSEINFAGHYTLVSWGCGSPCMWGAIIDVKTGCVYDIPQSGEGYDCRQNSRMLLVNPPAKKEPADPHLYYFKNRPYDVPEIYIFNDSTKKFKKYRYR